MRNCNDTRHVRIRGLLQPDTLSVWVLQYDLRVVFVHDGLYGRKHLYSYVHDKSCWWKIADSLIERVIESPVDAND